MASADPSVLEFSEVAGPDQLQLFARALPYRPLRIGGKQRAEFTWYPGSPSAVVQMLGPEEEPITMQGFWKDRFLAAITGAGAGQAFFNGTPVYSVTDLVAIVDGLRRSGKKFKLSWDKLVRYGHITGFAQTWHTPHDCEWDLEFSVTAQEEEAELLVNADPISVVNKAYVFPALQRDLPTELPLVAEANALRAAVFAAQTAVNNIVGQVSGIATQLASAVLSPFAAARNLSSTMSQGLTSLAATSSAITDRALAELYAFSGGQNAAPVGQQVAGASYQRQWGSALRAVQSACAYTRSETEKQLQSELIASFTADREMDFRDVALMFYGSQDGWRDLMIRNGYPNSRLKPGDLVWVPQRSNIPGEVGSAGSAGRPTASW